MISRMQLKRAVKGGAGLAAVAASPFVRTSRVTTGCILAYHRVADIPFIDPTVDDWNVTPETFERQLVALMSCSDIVPLAEILPRCQSSPSGGRPLVALTFDDGYANFHSQVLPALKRHGVPATVFVVTSFVGSSRPLPFDGWSTKNWGRVAPDAWLPMSWEQVEQCASSGLVSIGGHSHRHSKATECSPQALVEEAQRSWEILHSRLGEVAAYAYPYGSTRLGYVPSTYVRAVAAAGYRFAVTYDLGRVTSQADPLRMPRIEAHGTDGAAVMRAKVLGSLTPYLLTDRLRRTQRSA